MRNKLFMAILLGLVSSALVSCGNDAQDNDAPLKERQDIILSRADEKVRDANYDFSLDLLDVLIKDERMNSTFIISPLGVGYDLAALSYGADHKTAEEICNAMGGNVNEIIDFYTRMVSVLPECDNATSFSQAFSLWYEDGVAIEPSFQDFLSKTMGFECFEIDDDFTSKFNKWVAENTSGKLSDFNMEGVYVALANVLDFESRWATPAEDISVEKLTFNGEKETTKTKFLIFKELPVFSIDDQVIWVPIPYGNASFYLDLLMPTENIPLSEFITTLKTIESLSSFDTNIPRSSHIVEFPMFNTNTYVDYSFYLPTLGIKRIFKTGMSNVSSDEDFPSGILLDSFPQETSIEIDEKGSKVVAATIAEGAYGAGVHVYPTTKVTFDRPFIYLIREQSTGTIIFAGAVTDL